MSDSGCSAPFNASEGSAHGRVQLTYSSGPVTAIAKGEGIILDTEIAPHSNAAVPQDFALRRLGILSKMSSKAEATLTCKSFGANALPNKADVGVATTLKKKAGDATLSLQFSDASLRDPKSLNGVILSAEQKLADGVTGNVAYNFGKKDTLAIFTIDKKISGYDSTIKLGVQPQKGVFTINETWKFDKSNKMSASYNFSTEEAVFSYEHTRGPLKLAGLYNLKTEKPVLSVERKQGKHTVSASYGIKDEAAALTWSCKPLKAVVKAAAGKTGVTGVSAALAITHEFEL